MIVIIFSLGIDKLNKVMFEIALEKISVILINISKIFDKKGNIKVNKDKGYKTKDTNGTNIKLISILNKLI